MIFYLVCIAILVEFLVTLGWLSVIFGLIGMAIAVPLFRTRRQSWWRLPLSAAALAGSLTAIYSFGVVTAFLTCALVFGVVSCAWVAGHSTPERSHRTRR